MTTDCTTFVNCRDEAPELELPLGYSDPFMALRYHFGMITFSHFEGGGFWSRTPLAQPFCEGIAQPVLIFQRK